MDRERREDQPGELVEGVDRAVEAVLRRHLGRQQVEGGGGQAPEVEQVALPLALADQGVEPDQQVEGAREREDQVRRVEIESGPTVRDLDHLALAVDQESARRPADQGAPQGFMRLDLLAVREHQTVAGREAGGRIGHLDDDRRPLDQGGDEAQRLEGFRLALKAPRAEHDDDRGEREGESETNGAEAFHGGYDDRPAKQQVSCHPNDILNRAQTILFPGVFGDSLQIRGRRSTKWIQGDESSGRGPARANPLASFPRAPNGRKRRGARERGLETDGKAADETLAQVVAGRVVAGSVDDVLAPADLDVEAQRPIGAEIEQKVQVLRDHEAQLPISISAGTPRFGVTGSSSWESLWK